MIQRIQTVYLIIVGVFSVFGLFRDLGTFLIDDLTPIAYFSNFRFLSTSHIDGCSSPWALGVLLILVALLTPFSILLYRKRMRQMRFVLLQIILLVGYIVVYGVFSFIYYQNISEVTANESLSFRPTFSAVLPILSLILCILAFAAIRKDEALVRSLDRLR